AIVDQLLPGTDDRLLFDLAARDALGRGLHRPDEGGAAVLDAVDLAQRLVAGAEHAGKAAEALQQRLGDRFRVLARNGIEQQQFKQLVVGEGAGAAGEEALAQALAVAEVVRLVGAAPRQGEAILLRGQVRWGGRSSPAGERVKISKPAAVTATVCSNCADSERSRVTAVHPSSSTFTSWRPALIIGSTVKNMPSRRASPTPG